MFRGYWNAPDLTAAAFTEDGWYQTGDLGHFDDAGRLILSGRKKDMIVLPNGFNVYPEDIENALRIAGLRDSVVLETIYGPAKKWLGFLHARTSDGLLQRTDKHWGKFLGDWAAPGGRKERGDSPEAKFFNNCVYAYNLELVIRMAKVLGKPDDAPVYRDRLQELRKNIHASYFDPAKNSYANGTQVQLAFALLAGVVPGDLRPAVEASLVKEFAAKGYLDMGSSGLPILLKLVTETGDMGRELYPHFASTAQPSYGYFLAQGESTWPEYW